MLYIKVRIGKTFCLRYFNLKLCPTSWSSLAMMPVGQSDLSSPTTLCLYISLQAFTCGCSALSDVCAFACWGSENNWLNWFIMQHAIQFHGTTWMQAWVSEPTKLNQGCGYVCVQGANHNAIELSSPEAKNMLEFEIANDWNLSKLCSSLRIYSPTSRLNILLASGLLDERKC